MTTPSTPRPDAAPSPLSAAHDRSLAGVLAALRPLDGAAMARARDRQAVLTKPLGALGVLEDVSVLLAGITGACPPPVPHAAAVAVFAADHGVHAQAVTPWPQEVTAQMVLNFLAGGAAVNALARQAGVRVVVVDVGVAGPVPEAAGLWARRIRSGTRDLTLGPAMTPAEALAALEVGIAVAVDLVAAGADCLLTGDMGIANTTSSAALIAAFTGADAAEVTGRGTGVDDLTLATKVAVVRRGLARHADAVTGAAAAPLGVLAALGGLEHAALAGFVLAGAALRVPVILDGVIAGAAALAARALADQASAEKASEARASAERASTERASTERASTEALPAARQLSTEHAVERVPARERPDAAEPRLDVARSWIAGHRSAERGHAVALAALGLRPLVELDLRLGEGTGAVLALPLVQAAARALQDMATFDSAGVVHKDGLADQDGEPVPDE